MAEARKRRKASWRDLPPSEKAAHLLNTPTITDRAWTREPRLSGETRTDFVHRILGDEATKAESKIRTTEQEKPTAEPDMPVAKAVEPVGPYSGYYLLNTDAGNAGDRWGPAAIGALLRLRKNGRLITVGCVSTRIGSATHNVLEYQALIAGLKLARRHRVQRIRVFMDSELVVDQVNGISAVKNEALKGLHNEACSLRALFPDFRISWVPREMNVEADQLVRDALAGTDRLL